MLASLTFATPGGAFVALFALLPAAAYALTERRLARGRAVLRLAPAGRGHHIMLAVLLGVPLLVGLAAAGPGWKSRTGRRVESGAQAVFIVDTSRSMAASASAGAPTRMAEAKRAAIELRASVPEIPSGVASLTTQLLPHLFPSVSLAAFDSTVERAIGVEKPPPPALALGLTGTSFRPLIGLRNTGYFNPETATRFAILLTDGESAQIDPASLAQALVGSNPAYQQGGQFGGNQFPGSRRREEAPVHLLIVRVGSARDRIYSGGHVEAGYRPDPRAREIVDTLAADAHARAFTSVASAAAALRTEASAGHEALRGTQISTRPLARYVVLLAFVPLAVLIRRRNFAAL